MSVAVTSRWRGMLPMISEFAEQRNQIIALKDKLRVTELARDQAVAETAKAEDIATNAVQTLEQVHKALAAAKAAACDMQERMEVLREAHKRELDGKQKDLSRLHDTLKALKEKVDWLALDSSLMHGSQTLQEAKQKQEIERLREEAKASAALLHERAASLWNSLAEEDLGTDSGELHAQGLHNETFEPKFSQLEGSQATIERVSSTMSRKRKGSEDELVVLGEDAYEPLEHDVNHGRPRSSPKRRLVESKPSILSAPRFPSDWQLEGANASQKRAISGERPHVPLALDRKGKPLKPVQCASRTKFHRNS
ncbi:hypothetical protein BN946_scf184917.g20 [Trametes cinnabarina]|uniref:Uncharacterized protein n=1 Tax=Pycnoporus cinnabarinus TaxID=5643 RepID=A0A060SVV5_PYCCI|nr:hypothetical protein BN946_scf184917.g20 [Trametes cinnabarina]